MSKEAQAEAYNFRQALSKFTGQQLIYEQKIAEISEKISELGTMPNAEMFEQFDNLSSKELFGEFKKTKTALQNYRYKKKLVFAFCENLFFFLEIFMSTG